MVDEKGVDKEKIVDENQMDIEGGNNEQLWENDWNKIITNYGLGDLIKPIMNDKRNGQFLDICQ